MENDDKNVNVAIEPHETDEEVETIKNYAEQLKGRLIYFFDVPEKFRCNPIIVKLERDLGIRKSVKKGYDVIRNSFFVEEVVLTKFYNEITKKEVLTLFEDFSSYYEFLQGNIYENACYYKYKFSQEEISLYSIELNKINKTSLINFNIDDFPIDFTKDELKQYLEAESRKIYFKEWTEKFNSCKNYEEFNSVYLKFKRIKLLNRFFNFFLYNFIFYDKIKALDIIMQFIKNNCSLSYNNIIAIEKSLCLIYEPQEVLKVIALDHRQELEWFTNDLGNNRLLLSYKSYFDLKTHYFVYECVVRNKVNNYIETKFAKNFETFEELAKFLDYDLSYCDFSKAILLKFDTSKYIISKYTKLPIQYRENLSYNIIKIFDRQKDGFTVIQEWKNKNNKSIKNYCHTFKYFFDFVHFLKADLSGADLLFCDGLQNVIDFSDLNLVNARLKSDIFDKIGACYDLTFNENINCFPSILNNEQETAKALTVEREILNFDEINNYKIFYISDLHLLHRFKNSNCKTYDDAFWLIQKIIDRLLYDIRCLEDSIVLIGGDTASNFSLFSLFVKILRNSIDKNNLHLPVIFTLGNHELWSFEGWEFEKIVNKYREIITENKMYLLQNSIIFKDKWGYINEVDANKLKSLSKTEFKNFFKTKKLILFGGLGFSGYNEKFNANHFIYRSTISRQKEIEESKEFELLYEKVRDCLSERRVIILTHMPQKDWCSHNEPNKGFVYVSGHTHKNYFYDDGDYRIYSDNQIGYKQENCRLKFFFLESDYDIFINHKDGIYEISRDEYISFCRGKNITITFKRDFHKLYMLKKNDYYMFVLQNSNNKYYILNGGGVKRLAHNSINFYYENMEKAILNVKNPFDEYYNYQKQIAAEIKAIGGIGSIHGAIIDIDFFNHIYLNPTDLKITAYFAFDMIYKYVFKNTSLLLQINCPEIYENYLNLIGSNSNSLISVNNSNLAKDYELYLETDIYRASREIKKMQKLNSNILSVWVEQEVKKLSN